MQKTPGVDILYSSMIPSISAISCLSVSGSGRVKGRLHIYIGVFSSIVSPLPFSHAPPSDSDT